MTIAIGLLASDGILIATDREASDSVRKVDEGKVRGCCVSSPPYDSLFIAGAGHGDYIDAVTDKLLGAFPNGPMSSVSELMVRLANQNRDFYRENVLPLSRYPSEERPDYSLLIAAKLNNDLALWSSSFLVLNQITHAAYGAIGAGAMTAKTLLRKFYAYTPLVNTIVLSIYIVQEVKRLVPYCGLDTDILYVQKNREPAKLVGDEVREIENAFRRFDKVERAHFHQSIGSDLTFDPRTKTQDVAQQKESYQKFFRELNERLTKRLAQ